MKRLQRITAAFITLLLILTSLAAISVFAEGEETGDTGSSPAVESSSPAEEESSSSAEEESSSSAEEKSSSSAEPESTSSSSEEESSSSEEEESESEESRGETRPSSSSSSEEETYAQTLVDDETGIMIGLSQPNDKLTLTAHKIEDYESNIPKDVHDKITDAANGKELVAYYRISIGGDEDFKSKVTIMLPASEDVVGRSMAVLFFTPGGSHVEKSTKNVVAITSATASSDESEEPTGGVIRVSETLEAGRDYYFAICEPVDYVPASGGLGGLEILLIIIAVMALASGGLLALLWTRYNKKQSGAPARKK